MTIYGLIKFLFLFLPTIYLGLRHYHISIVDNPEYKIRRTTFFSLLLFIMYLCLIIIVGPSSLENHLSDYYSEKSFFTYILPGFGFAFAAFPYEASEFSKDFINITVSGLNDIYAVFGWLMLIVLFLKLTIFNV